MGWEVRMDRRDKADNAIVRLAASLGQGLLPAGVILMMRAKFDAPAKDPWRCEDLTGCRRADAMAGGDLQTASGWGGAIG